MAGRPKTRERLQRAGIVPEGPTGTIADTIKKIVGGGGENTGVPLSDDEYRAVLLRIRDGAAHWSYALVAEREHRGLSSALHALDRAVTELDRLAIREAGFSQSAGLNILVNGWDASKIMLGANKP